MDICYVINDKYSKGVDIKSTPFYSLTIDTGLVTSGFCLIDFQTKKVSLDTINTKSNYMSSNFLENYSMSKKQVSVYLNHLDKLLPNFDLSKFHVNIEHTVYNPDFQFSIGLNIFLTYLLDQLLFLGVPLIKLIPPKTPQYFLQQQGKLKETDIKLWIKFFMPMFYEKATSAHSRDALLHSLFLHYDFYQEHYNIKAKLPVYRLIDIKEK